MPLIRVEGIIYYKGKLSIVWLSFYGVCVVYVLCEDFRCVFLTEGFRRKSLKCNGVVIVRFWDIILRIPKLLNYIGRLLLFAIIISR